MKLPELKDAAGRPLLLGKKLGKGGEGAVFEVSNAAGLVAKIYASTPSAEKVQKLIAMTRGATPAITNLAAWPTSIIQRSSDRQVVGFLMPRVQRVLDLHKVYGPRSRLQFIPDRDYRFLIRVAANAARAFHSIHKHDHVIGDVNHGNVVVSADATVRLIDCDSFQVSADGKLYACDVGVLMYQPPEMQSISNFRGIRRTRNHDYFGLAVQIFQLLFLGRHPFIGLFSGKGEMTPEKAILEGRFAYGRASSFLLMRPPPASLRLEAFTPEIGGLFERAFDPRSKSSGRPTTEEWVNALIRFEQTVRVCKTNVGHAYFSSLTECPICKVEATVGTILFIPPIHTIAPTGTGFNLTLIWSQIEKLQILPFESAPAPTLIRGLRPDPAVERAREGRHAHRMIALAFLASAVMLAFLVGAGGKNNWVYIFLIVTIVWTIFAWSTGSKTLKRTFRERLMRYKEEYSKLSEEWDRLMKPSKFDDLKSELRGAKSDYERVPKLRAEKLAQLEATRRQQQMSEFLDRFTIEGANISGIGSSRVAILEAFGIETAADIDYNKIINIQGFGPKTTKRLTEWRAHIERKFVFDPRKGIDAAKLASLEQSILQERLRLEKILLEGLRRLRHEIETNRARRDALRPNLERLSREVAVAELNLRRL